MAARGFADRERKRRYNEIHEGERYQKRYAGPSEFLEAGTRGFLVTTHTDKEEYGIDDAVTLLRQAAIKLHGGIKAGKNTDLSQGYVQIDFMDPKDIVRIPNPDGDDEEEEKDTQDTATKVETSQSDSDKKDVQNKELSAEKEDDEEPKDAEMKDVSTEKKDEESQEQKKSDELMETAEEKIGDDSQNQSEKENEKKESEVFMKTTYKFKAYRTEMRYIMFIKSDYPDPSILAAAAMDILMARKSIYGDAVIQLLPCIGTCDFDLFQLEVMSRHVLAPLFNEDLAPKSFNIMLHDKMSEPGSHLMMEILRNCIWSLNPEAYQASPLTEPDLVLRLEVIGTKIVLCCMTNFIKYRQYAPTVLVHLGEGEPEDDDLTHCCLEQRKEWAVQKEIIRKQEEALKERQRRQEEERKQREEEKRLRKEEEAKERAIRRAEKEKRDQEWKEKLKKVREEREKERKAMDEKIKKEKEKKRLEEEKRKIEEEKRKEEEKNNPDTSEISKNEETTDESQSEVKAKEDADNQNADENESKVEEEKKEIAQPMSDIIAVIDKPSETEPIKNDNSDGAAVEVEMAEPLNTEEDKIQQDVQVSSENIEEESAAKPSRSKRRRSKK